MTRYLFALTAVLLGVTLSAQQRTPQVIADDLEGLVAELKAALATPVPDPVITVTVADGGDIQAAVDTLPAEGGIVQLAAGGAYTVGELRLPSHTTLKGNGASIHATAGRAIDVRPGTTDVRVEDVVATSTFNAVIEVGRSDETQATLAQVPQRVTFVRVTVPSHRGVRAFSIHGATVVLQDCEVADTYDPSLHDSQAVWINNTPGPVLITGGQYAAGSEVIMVGGAVTPIAGLIPADITVQDTRLYRPLEWHTDGVKRGVKNIFELKTGERVKVLRTVMEGSWTDAQVSCAILLTPRSAGAIADVTFDGLTVRHVGGGISIMGENHVPPPTPFVTTGVVVKNSTFVLDKATYGGQGLLAMIQMGPGTIDFDNIVSITDLKYSRQISVVDTVPVGAVRVRHSFLAAPYYTSVATPISVASGDLATAIGEIVFEGNTVAAASAKTKTLWPANTWVTRAEFDALVAPRFQ